MKIGRATRIFAAALVAFGFVSSPIAQSFGQGLPGKPPKEKREDAKERAEDRKERREDAKEKAEERAEDRDKLKPEWKKKRDEWRDKRKERRDERRDEIKKKLGDDALKRPAVRAELRVHAVRLARLNRVLFLAEANDKTKVADHVKELITKENARHDKRVEALKTDKTEEPK